MGSEFERRDLERRDLERLAFGKPMDGADAGAAREALLRLAADERTALPAVPEAVEPQATAAGPDQPIVNSETDDGPPVLRSRRFLPVIAAAGAIAMLAVGFSLGRVLPTGAAGHTPNPSASLFSQFAPSTTFQLQPTASSSAALAELALPQKPGDVPITPDLVSSLGLERSSLHRVLEVSGGITLWVGRTQKAARTQRQICMMFTGGAGFAVGASCATSKQFDNGGLTLEADTFNFTWDGTTFGTSSTG